MNSLFTITYCGYLFNHFWKKTRNKIVIKCQNLNSWFLVYDLLALEMTPCIWSKSKLCYFLDVQSKCFTVQGMLCCHNSSFLTWKHRTFLPFCTLTGAYMYVVFESVAFPCSIPDEYGISDMTVNLTEKDICSGRIDSTQRKIFHSYIIFIILN